ncbi:MerR family transcriptional regulator [Microbispora amethystogenes]|uniref:MerR family transcriptional regulator n=1 Tax=Microbispora amethystogenes TaxID=1427754 RepID=UPI0034095CEE
MDGDTLCSIGELAARTGLTIKAIRFYSDRGIVPPTDRSPAGHRRYGPDAVARLDLVRTLRDLGIDLPTIRKVLDRDATLAEVAAAHAEALAVQIRVLRLRHAVALAVARRGSTPEETDLMHRLARLTEDERRRLIDDFLDAAFGELDADLTGIRRTMTPELPDDPEPEQVEAWVELAELSADPAFRATLRRIAEQHVADRAAATAPRPDTAPRPEAGPHRGTAPHPDTAPRPEAATRPDTAVPRPDTAPHPDTAPRPEAATRPDTAVPRPDAVAIVRDQVAPALAAGVDPASSGAGQYLAAITARYAATLRRPDDAALRRRLLTLLETANDPRRQTYSRLLAVVNGWPPPDDPTPALTWCVRALRTRTPG